MASSRDRQRALARAKLNRQLARRAAAQRKRRQMQAGIAVGVAVVLVAIGVAWSTGLFSHDDKKKSTAAEQCAWTPVSTTGNQTLKDVGKPPTTGIQTSGEKSMTITTNQGVLTARLDAATAPCAVASMSYLAGKNFFDNSPCHRLTTSGIFVLQCGDPSGTGTGGPTYRFADESLPKPAPSASGSDQPNYYPKGTLAMANSGADTNGSQFFIVYKDGSALGPQYTPIGTVVSGLEVVERVAAAGVADANGQPATDGKPKLDTVIQSLTVGEGAPAVTTPSGAPAASGAPSPSTQPSKS